MKDFKITFENGNTIVTGFNGNLETAAKYYLNQAFNFGDTEEHPKDIMVKGIAIKELVS